MGGYEDLDSLAASARAELVREIELSGAWTADPVWREAFRKVPRHLFVPYYYVGVRGGYERRSREVDHLGAGGDGEDVPYGRTADRPGPRGERRQGSGGGGHVLSHGHVRSVRK